MTVRNLKHMFRATSVAVIGASTRPQRVGSTVLADLMTAGFKGNIYPVNPKYAAVAGLHCYAAVEELPACPDLAVICTPPATIPAIIAELGRRGCRAAVVLSAGMSRPDAETGITHQQAMLEAARPWLLRILGPNCVGLIVPKIGLNASFAHAMALPGKLAFATQSGALATAVLDWSLSRGIGFSHFISLGDSADVDVADVLDYLASEADTHAVLLYVEGVRDGRKFMSAARAAARNKPVLIVKAGRTPESAKAAASHTGALAGADDVYDAAIRRAGLLRVDTTEDLFDAVETLARARPLYGEQLAIVTNGGGAGVMATDALLRGGGALAALPAGTIARLDAALPSTWSHGNPVDIAGDAPVARYVDVVRALAEAPGIDALLLLHAPTAIARSAEIAEAIVEVARSQPVPLFTSWLGGDAVSAARRLCRDAGIPTYDTPEQAIKGFLQVTTYRRNQALLMQTPPSVSPDIAPDNRAARRIIDTARQEGRTLLHAHEAKGVLAAYGIPVVETRTAPDAESAILAARDLGFPVALKIVSPDISHKSDAGGVALDLRSDEQVLAVALAMVKTVRERAPLARIEGFSVQRMVTSRTAFELILGAANDSVFGPVMLFGHGGTAVERIRDCAVALPPLNPLLAAELVSRTRISHLLSGYRNVPPVDIDAVIGAIQAVSQLVCDVEDIIELDINPLVAAHDGVIALDARIALRGSEVGPRCRLAILPYPATQERPALWQGEALTLRPVRPDDEPAYRVFFQALAPSDVHSRYLCMFRQPEHSQLARMTQIDYAREMCFVAVRQGMQDGDKSEFILGECRAVADPDNQRAEFAISVRSDVKGKGLGTLLLHTLLDYCRAQGTAELYGVTEATNAPMLALARRFDFELTATPDGIHMRRALAGVAPAIPTALPEVT
ncbi:Peptidyl-lysine N-acetyltransferase Pat [Cupriavidus campinensis]|uniref:bifunctional acetate--CoA ligase family protein/GNAT family N-acetyltransferase n=1 Tax=Cupriavidus campinensis TaxID=151783 RepID=UPI001B0163F3|nr:bifunctional acetate--CoA ligase family protein/GNAT family N-acetyltransferase [Cupriavidus campinensis]CAG2139596.1 Peptidyl-lysine N-acetyltransferase Pat [Cupriavidus campinensis]